MIRKIARYLRILSRSEQIMLGYVVQGLTEEEVYQRWRNDLREFTLWRNPPRPQAGEDIRAGEAVAMRADGLIVVARHQS